jgi:hypothetical protein
MQIRRLATCSVATVALGSLLVAPTALAGPRHPSPIVGTVGQIAFVTKSQTVKLATVHTDGSTSDIQTVGPVTPLTGKQTIQIVDFMASGDGQWLAWEENVFKPAHPGLDTVKSVLVLRDEGTAKTIHLTTGQAPVGFANDQLVTSDAGVTKRLDLTPSPHLVTVPDHQFPLAAYSHGVIDTHSLRAPSGPSMTEQLRLTTFAGVHATLHNYVLAPTDYRFPDLGWVSGDGANLVIERGNHQDFGGLGPSSLADEFSLAAGHARHALGHYGTAKAAWRIASVTFVGPSDVVWAVWERATRSGADSLLARWTGHQWVAEKHRAIAAAGASNGWVVIQPGKYVLASHNEEIFTTAPTGHALLRKGTRAPVSINVEGTAFVWVGGPV